MRAFNFGTYGRARPAKKAVRAAVPCILLARKRMEVNSSRAHHMDPDQDIYYSKEPSVVHGSQPPGTVAAREAAQRSKSALLA